VGIMPSPKQIEASRINGRRSKGPIAPEGIHNSSRNNTRHGLLAQTVVLEGESEERFNALLEHYMQIHQPQSPIEAGLIEHMAVAQWRLMRAWGTQKLALDHDIASQDPGIGPASVRAMFAMRGSVENSSRPDLLLRYEVTFDRQFKSALRLLQAQSKLRKPSAKPYFPDHPSGQTWKPEACSYPPAEKPNKNMDEKANEKIPSTIRTQEVAETK
jgi:hypothetical protein